MDLHPAVRIQEYVLHELLLHLFRHLRDFEKRLYRLDLLSRLIVRILCQLFRHARIGYLLLRLCDFRIITRFLSLNVSRSMLRSASFSKSICFAFLYFHILSG